MSKSLVVAAAALFAMTALPAHSTDNGIYLGASVGAGGIVLQGAATGADTIRIHPASAFTLQLGGERLAYRGDLLVHRKGQKLVLVNEVDLADDGTVEEIELART